MPTTSIIPTRVTAGGDTEQQRWRHPDGRAMVLTHRGRLLKHDHRGRYLAVIRDRPWTSAHAAAYAHNAGFQPVASRGTR